MKSTWVRTSLLAFVTVAVLALLPGNSTAQSAQADVPPEKAKQFLQLLSDPEVKTWLEGKSATAPAEQPAGSLSDAISDWEAAVHDRLGALAGAVPRVPAELSAATAVVARDVNSGRPGLVIGILAVLIVVGFGAEWLIRRGLERVRKPGAAGDVGQAMLTEVAALLTFALASVGSFLAFEWPALLRRIVLTLLIAFIAVRVVRVIVKLLFASRSAGVDPTHQTGRPAEPKAAQSFWLRRFSLIAGVLFVGWAMNR